MLPPSSVYVALSDGRLVSLGYDLALALGQLSVREDLTLPLLFGELRGAIGASLHRHRHYALAEQLPGLRLQAEAVSK